MVVVMILVMVLVMVVVTVMVKVVGIGIGIGTGNGINIGIGIGIGLLALFFFRTGYHLVVFSGRAPAICKEPPRPGTTFTYSEAKIITDKSQMRRDLNRL